ncbi:MAG: hypothetical protein AAGI90_04340 [Chlamydiota bacterium]
MRADFRLDGIPWSSLEISIEKEMQYLKNTLLLGIFNTLAAFFTLVYWPDPCPALGFTVFTLGSISCFVCIQRTRERIDKLINKGTKEGVIQHLVIGESAPGSGVMNARFVVIADDKR